MATLLARVPLTATADVLLVATAQGAGAAGWRLGFLGSSWTGSVVLKANMAAPGQAQSLTSIPFITESTGATNNAGTAITGNGTYVVQPGYCVYDLYAVYTHTSGSAIVTVQTQDGATASGDFTAANLDGSGSQNTFGSNVPYTGAYTFPGALAITGALTGVTQATFSTKLVSVTALATPSALAATALNAFASTVSGAVLMGYGTTYDVTLKNRAGTDVLGIGPNTTAAVFAGAVTSTGNLTVGASTFVVTASTGAVALRGVQALVMPDQATFTGSLIVGSGGTGLTHAAGIEGTDNTIVGIGAGMGAMSGDQNTAVGFYSGHDTTTGYHNTFIGAFAGNLNTTGNYNTYVGTDAGNQVRGAENTLIGASTGNAVSTYSGAVMVGANAGLSTTGDGNTFVGRGSGYANTTGYGNVFTGLDAALANTTGYLNVFSGKEVAYSNTTGYRNVFAGYRAGYSHVSGYDNVFLGTQSGYAVTTGNTNIFIGYQAGVDASQKVDVVNSIVLGNGAFSTADNQVVLGGPSITQTIFRGFLEGTEVAAPAAPAANKGRIFFQDNGAGKTQLMCIFASGAAQQLAIEP